MPVEHESRAVYPKPMFSRTREEQLRSDQHIRHMLEVILWKGLPSPVPRGPQFSSAVEAIMLDELLCFNDLLSGELDTSEAFAQATQPLVGGSELAQILGRDQTERLFKIDEPPPQIQNAEELYGPAFESFLVALLSAIERAIGQLFSPEAFLRLRLGGPKGIITLFRTLSSLFPVKSRPLIRSRFEWAAVCLHYFVTLILSVRRSFLAAKAFLSPPSPTSAPSPESANPLSTVLEIWETALTVRLEMWSHLIVMDDLQPLTQVVNPNAVPQRSGDTDLYVNVMELRWYHVPAPGAPWQIAVPVQSSSTTQTVKFLETVVAEELSILSLCHFATSIFTLMVAASSMDGWEADPAWSVLIGVLHRSLAWEFQPPIDSSKSDIAEEIAQRGPSMSPEHGGDIQMADGEHRRSGTPVSLCSSLGFNNIIATSATAMRASTGNISDGKHIGDDMDLIPSAAAYLDDGECVEEGDANKDNPAIEQDPHASEAAGGGALVIDRAPKKPGNALVPTSTTQRVLRTRNAESDEKGTSLKRKALNVTNADPGAEAGPPAAKRRRTRADFAKQLDAGETSTVAETLGPKGGRTKPIPKSKRGGNLKAAAKPKAIAKTKAPPKPKASSNA